MYLLLILPIIYSNVFFFFKKTFLLTFLVLTIYWLLNIFIYLYNISRISRQTTAVTRFWRRGLVLFWMIELFLFSTYVYLVLNCAIETEWLAHQNQLFNYNKGFTVILLKSTLVLIMLTLSLVLLNKFNLTKNNLSFRITILITFMCVLFLLVEESCQFANFCTFYHNTVLLFDDEFGSWEFVTSKTPTLIIYQYLSLIILLKYLHALFVYILLLVILRIYVRDNYSNTSNFFKSSLLNIMFIWFFSYIPMVTTIKYTLNAFYSKTYFWFYVNKSSTTLMLLPGLFF